MGVVTPGELREYWRADYTRLVAEIDARLELARAALDRVQVTTARELLAEVSVLLDQKDRVTTIMEEFS